MKKFIGIILVIMIIMSEFIILTENGFGEENDPLVTQSYVEMRFDEILQYIDNKLGTTNSSTDNIESGFKPIELTQGNKLIGEEGTEIIVRVGKVKAVTNLQGGIVDITSGVDIQNGKDIQTQHLIIIPRSDGRGISVSDDKAYIMIKGKYNIFN